ncbi:MAG: aminotransferase class V-fold PLP-dependent enzyme [Moraxellaceae bacterium]|nr:aminotransferase class V-fold PLP-dependent enzyme [Pseudobdellovibrionaceae bacterium]
MYKKYFSKFIKANEGIQHYAAHSHHYWPDVTLDATIEYWNDSAQMVDNKWDHILGKKVPQTQKLISEILNFSTPENICFAPNTHDLLIRIISTFENKKIKVLATDSEFYSFSRQAHRLSELNLIDLTLIPSQPFDNFTERFISEIQKQDYDLVFISQVFFNSGIVVEDLETIVKSVPNPKTIIMIDGYHGFMAIPTDISKIEDRVFYMSGSYKYAQGGEGCCFMTIPKGCELKPTITGWWAGFNDLENTTSVVTYPNDGYRFAGSTSDYTPLYRLHAVLKLYKDHHISVGETHAYVQRLQKNFLNELDQLKHPHLNRKNLLILDENNHGHFLAFKMPSVEICNQIKKDLLEKKITTDSRGDVLRFGFGIYQNEKISGLL